MATPTDDAGVGDAPDRNEVVLVGRVTAAPREVQLPSGDALVAVRVSVRRSVGGGRRGFARQLVDALDCAALRGDLRRRVATWQVGDRVEVAGAVRRRFRRGPAGVESRWEVELGRARRLQRASGTARGSRDEAGGAPAD